MTDHPTPPADLKKPEVGDTYFEEFSERWGIIRAVYEPIHDDQRRWGWSVDVEGLRENPAELIGMDCFWSSRHNRWQYFPEE